MQLLLPSSETLTRWAELLWRPVVTPSGRDATRETCLNDSSEEHEHSDLASRRDGNPAALNLRLTGMKNLIVLIALALAAAACGGGETAGDTTSPSLPEGQWQLVEGVALADGFPITMTIDDRHVRGRGSCNSYIGNVAVDGSAISISGIGQTDLSCDSSVMDPEAEFLEVLGRVDSFEFTSGRLTLSGSTGDLVFGPAPDDITFPEPPGGIVGDPLAPTDPADSG